MSRRVAREVRGHGGEESQLPPVPERPPLDLLRLQQTAGNQAVTRLLQRKVRVPGAVIDASNYPSRKAGLEKALQDLAKEKDWKEPFVAKVRTRMVEMINDETMYPDETHRFDSNKDFIRTVARQLLLENAPSPGLGKDLPPLDPWKVQPGEAMIDPEYSLLEQIHDEASMYREEYMEEMPDEFQVGASRRTAQKGGTLDTSVIPQVAIGGYTGEIRGHGSVVTKVGGGKGGTYAELFGDFTTGLTIGKKTEKEAGEAILAMLHGDPSKLLTYSNFSLIFLDEALTVLAGAESSRATGAVVHFAATIYRISLGQDTFVNAFSGKNATFLGANQGGADALRHQTSSSLISQESRARTAAEVYLSAWGSNVDLATLPLMLQTNIASYSRRRQEKKVEAKEKEKDKEDVEMKG